MAKKRSSTGNPPSNIAHIAFQRQKDKLYDIFPDDKDIEWYKQELTLLDKAIQETSKLQQIFSAELARHKKHNPLSEKLKEYESDKEGFAQIFAEHEKKLLNSTGKFDISKAIDLLRIRRFLKIKDNLQHNVLDYQQQLQALLDNFQTLKTALEELKCHLENIIAALAREAHLMEKAQALFNGGIKALLKEIEDIKHKATKEIRRYSNITALIQLEEQYHLLDIALQKINSETLKETDTQKIENALTDALQAINKTIPMLRFNLEGYIEEHWQKLHHTLPADIEIDGVIHQCLHSKDPGLPFTELESIEALKFVTVQRLSDQVEFRLKGLSTI